MKDGEIAYAAARVVLAAQNALLKLSERALFRRQECSPQSILVFRSSAIGDFVCALPALYQLRQRFPRSRIILLTTPTGNPRYWNRMPEAGGRRLASPRLVDNVVFFYAQELKQRQKFLELRRQVKQLEPGLTFLLPFSGEPFLNRMKKILLLRLLGVRRNLRGYAMRCSLGVFRRAQFLRGRFPHQAVSALEAVNGAEEPASEDVVFWMDQPAQAAERVDELWERLGLNGLPVVAVSPGARFEHKRWPIERFAELCQGLQREYPVQVVVIGGAEDRALGAALAESVSGGVLNLAGETTLAETTEVLRRSRLFIGNDSGPAHLAAAVGTPCVTIFSSVVFPGIWEPWGEQNLALRYPVPCQFCFSEGHCRTGTMECIRGITVERVLAAARQFLGKMPTESQRQVTALGATP